MKTIFTAAAIALAIGAGSAHASSGLNGLGFGGTGRYADGEDGYIRGDHTEPPLLTRRACAAAIYIRTAFGNSAAR
jgi:hypothetical protein